MVKNFTAAQNVLSYAVTAASGVPGLEGIGTVFPEIDWREFESLDGDVTIDDLLAVCLIVAVPKSDNEPVELVERRKFFHTIAVTLISNRKSKLVLSGDPAKALPIWQVFARRPGTGFNNDIAEILVHVRDKNQ